MDRKKKGVEKKSQEGEGWRAGKLSLQSEDQTGRQNKGNTRKQTDRDKRKELAEHGCPSQSY